MLILLKNISEYASRVAGPLFSIFLYFALMKNGKGYVWFLVVFLNQACAGCRPARTWFLKITSVRACVGVCVCACVHVYPCGHE